MRHIRGLGGEHILVFSDEDEACEFINKHNHRQRFCGLRLYNVPAGGYYNGVMCVDTTHNINRLNHFMRDEWNSLKA